MYIVLSIFFLLLCSSLSHSHMSNPELEGDAHEVSAGFYLTKAGVVPEYSDGTILVFAPSLDTQHLYVVSRLCVDTDFDCPSRLGQYEHNVVLKDVGCQIVYSYLGRLHTKKWSDYYGRYVNSYSLVYQVPGPASLLKSDITTLENDKYYHVYRQQVSYDQDNGTQILGSQSSTVPRITKYLGPKVLQSNLYPGISWTEYNSTENYQLYKNWFSDFYFSQYRDAIGSDKYYITDDVPGMTGCIDGFYIETYFIIPICQARDVWRLKLCKRKDDGSLYCPEDSTGISPIMKFYGRPLFPDVPSVYLKDVTGGTLNKSDFVQDETIYTQGDQTYQGFEYWYVVAEYQGNFYPFKFLGSDPPCFNHVFRGVGALTSGSGADLKGFGSKNRGFGAYESNHNY